MKTFFLLVEYMRYKQMTRASKVITFQIFCANLTPEYTICWACGVPMNRRCNLVYFLTLLVHTHTKVAITILGDYPHTHQMFVLDLWKQLFWINFLGWLTDWLLTAGNHRYTRGTRESKSKGRWRHKGGKVGATKN